MIGRIWNATKNAIQDGVYYEQKEQQDSDHVRVTGTIRKQILEGVHIGTFYHLWPAYLLFTPKRAISTGLGALFAVGTIKYVVFPAVFGFYQGFFTAQTMPISGPPLAQDTAKVTSLVKRGGGIALQASGSAIANTANEAQRTIHAVHARNLLNSKGNQFSEREKNKLREIANNQNDFVTELLGEEKPHDRKDDYPTNKGVETEMVDYWSDR